MRTFRSPRALGALWIALWWVATSGAAGAETLRVGTSGDYPPFSQRGEDGEYEGFSIAVARLYAEDRGLELEWVPFAWPRLMGDLMADRFDVAMSGITVRPERSARAIFTVPVATTGAVVLVKPETWTDPAQLDKARIRIGVNAGGHLERVAAKHFPRGHARCDPGQRLGARGAGRRCGPGGAHRQRRGADLAGALSRADRARPHHARPQGAAGAKGASRARRRPGSLAGRARGRRHARAPAGRALRRARPAGRSRSRSRRCSPRSTSDCP